jgi:hypothetical protein
VLYKTVPVDDRLATFRRAHTTRDPDPVMVAQNVSDPRRVIRFYSLLASNHP